MTENKYEIVETVNEFYKLMRDDENHRYKSWEHCFTIFNSEEANKDILALHLAFYLASWGMYRGSSGLLQKDYKVHIGAVAIIKHSKYDALRCTCKSDNEYIITDEKLRLIIELKKEISEYYESMSADGKRISVTDTLFTKILMGTLGCTPAYDRLFKAGVGCFPADLIQLFSNNSLRKLSKFVGDRIDEFREVQESINKDVADNVHYPLMKIVDMYFWQIGALEEMRMKEEKVKSLEWK